MSPAQLKAAIILCRKHITDLRTEFDGEHWTVWTGCDPTGYPDYRELSHEGLANLITDLLWTQLRAQESQIRSLEASIAEIKKVLPSR
jgi:hypothetical protein